MFLPFSPPPLHPLLLLLLLILLLVGGRSPADLVSLVVDELAVVRARGGLDGVVHAAAAGGRRERRRTDRVAQVRLHPARMHGQHDQAGHVTGELPASGGGGG